MQTGLSLLYKHVVGAGQSVALVLHSLSCFASTCPPPQYLLPVGNTGERHRRRSIMLQKGPWRHCSCLATYTDTLWGLQFCHRQPAKAGHCRAGRSAGSGTLLCCACTCISHGPSKGKRARITNSKAQRVSRTQATPMYRRYHAS